MVIKTEYKMQIIDSGHIDRRNSAFPTLVQLNNGDIICGFSVGGGPEATGGTDWARSTDGGKIWAHEGTILSGTNSPKTGNTLRISRTEEGVLIAYGQRTFFGNKGASFPPDSNEAVYCLSKDNGKTWSAPSVIPTSEKGPFEISNPIVVLSDGRWLAPAAILQSPERLGERVIAFESEDAGETWNVTRQIFSDAKGKKGFFEQKVIALDKSRLLALAWTVTLGDYKDLSNHFAVSEDLGKTWFPPVESGIYGQTMTPLFLGEDRLLLLYNRRYGRQGVVAAIVRFQKYKWLVEYESILWDAKKYQEHKENSENGIEEFDDFAFGLPSAIKLSSDTYLAVHWCKEDNLFGIRWTKFKIET